MDNETERENQFLKELNELMKKYKVCSLMTGEQGAIYCNEKDESCLTDEVYIRFK